MQDWLKQIADSMPVCDINLVGTHDSAARFVDFSYFARCQNKSIAEQLAMGIRFFDLRAEAEGDRIKLVHSVIDCRKSRLSRKRLYMDDVFAAMLSFLDKNPSEAIFVLFKQDDGISPAETFELFYDRYVARETRFFTENRIPRLGEVRGRIVLLNRTDLSACQDKFSDGSSGVNLFNWPEQHDYYPDWQAETPVHDLSRSNQVGSLLLQDFYRIPPQKKWEEGILPALTGAEQHKGFVLNYFSGSSGVLGPAAFEKVIRKKYRVYEFKKGRKYGWLVLDFPKPEIVERIVQTNQFIARE